MNILIVEDEPEIASVIKNIFCNNSSSHFVDISYSFESAFTKIHSEIFDMILLDIDLGASSHSGLDLCKIIRKNNKDIPIIIITAITSITYLEKAFHMGVNDYIKKPFHPTELSMRVTRWQELFQNNIKQRKQIEYQQLCYTIANNEFYFNGKPITLTKRNKKILSVFIKSPETIISSEILIQKVWGDFINTMKERNIRSNIQLLRKALDTSCGKWIQTVRGEGYILIKNKLTNVS